MGLVLALARPGFDITRHALSLLLLGDFGWLHASNFALTGLMTIVAGWGFIGAIRSGRGLAMGVLAIVYGAGLLLAMNFQPDAAADFPLLRGTEMTQSGMLHLVAAIGFLALAAAAFAYAGWCRSVQQGGSANIGYVAAVVIIVGFLGGAALTTSSIGIGLLWLVPHQATFALSTTSRRR